MPDRVVLPCIILMWLGQFGIYFLFPLFSHFVNYISLLPVTDDYLVAHPNEVGTAKAIGSMAFAVVSTTYILNIQVFFLHAIPLGVFLGAVLWRLPWLQSTTSKHDNSIDTIPDAAGAAQEMLIERFGIYADASHADEDLTDVLENDVWPDQIIALDLFSMVLVVFVPVALVAPALVLFYLVGSTYIWMYAWLSFWLSAFCCALFIHLLSISKAMNEPLLIAESWHRVTKALATAYNFICADLLVSRVLAAVFFLASTFYSLAVCLDQEARFPFFRSYWTSVLWTQVSILVATTITLLYILSHDDAKAIAVEEEYAAEHVDAAEYETHFVSIASTYLVKLIFLPFGLFTGLRKLVHRIILMLLSEYNKYQFFLPVEGDWYVQCYYYSKQLLKQLLTLPIVLLFGVILHSLVIIRSTLFLLTNPLRDKLPGFRLDYRNTFLLVGNIFLFFLIVDLYPDLSIAPKTLVSNFAAREGYQLVWPDGPSFLDAPFALYVSARDYKFAFLCVSLLMFVMANWLHHPYLAEADNGSDVEADIDERGFDKRVKGWGTLQWSRVCVYIGSFFILAAAMAASVPDYIKSAELNKILPDCAPKFNLAVMTIFRMVCHIHCAVFSKQCLICLFACLLCLIFCDFVVCMSRRRLTDYRIVGFGHLRVTNVRDRFVLNPNNGSRGIFIAAAAETRSGSLAVVVKVRAIVDSRFHGASSHFGVPAICTQRHG
jgi:hypothetical protein